MLDFIILVECIFHNNKMLWYIKYVLYQLKKIKLSYKYYWLINFQVY